MYEKVLGKFLKRKLKKLFSKGFLLLNCGDKY
jgi:hypothetical protein